MALKTFEFSLDIKSENSISLPNVVAGDTGNQFIIHVLDGGEPFDVSDAERVRFIITNKDGQGAQDTDFPYEPYGTAGIDYDSEREALIVYVFSSMVSNGLNTGCIEFYYDDGETLITTNDFTFTATNSPTEKAYAYPSLVAAEKVYQQMLQTLQSYIETIDPDTIMRYPTPAKANYLVETDGDGQVTFIHRLIITDQDPTSLTDLQEGDIVLSSYIG